MDKSIEDKALTGEVSKKQVQLYEVILAANTKREKDAQALKAEEARDAQEIKNMQDNAQIKKHAAYVAMVVYFIACPILLLMMFKEAPWPTGSTLGVFTWAFFHIIKHFFPSKEERESKKK